MIDLPAQATLDEIEGMDFGCEFIGNECVGMRKRAITRLKQIGKICCRACAHNVGYLKIKKADLPPEYLPFWDETLGFWRENVGCGLTREMRSRRCNVYTCRDSNISDTDRAILINLEETTE
jgi:hypothetical protein